MSRGRSIARVRARRCVAGRSSLRLPRPAAPSPQGSVRIGAGRRQGRRACPTLGPSRRRPSPSPAGCRAGLRGDRPQARPADSSTPSSSVAEGSGRWPWTASSRRASSERSATGQSVFARATSAATAATRWSMTSIRPVSSPAVRAFVSVALRVEASMRSSRAARSSSEADPGSGSAESASRMSSTIDSIRVLDSVKWRWRAASSCSFAPRLVRRRLDARSRASRCAPRAARARPPCRRCAVELLVGRARREPAERLHLRAQRREHRDELVGGTIRLRRAPLDARSHRRQLRVQRVDALRHPWIDAGSCRHRRDGAGELLDALAERADARGELFDLCGAPALRVLLHERRDGILERAELVDVGCGALRGRACRLRLRDQRLHRLVASLEVTAEARDLAVLLRHRRRGRRDGRGQRVDALHEHVETRREARFLLRVALRGRQHDSSRVPSTRAPLGTASRRASSRLSEPERRALAHSSQ